MRRRSLTLLEVVIGFALTAILLSFLFSSFRHMAKLGAKVQKGREAVHSRSIVQLRLGQLFENLNADEKKSSFYTDKHPDSFSEALYFTFDNGIDRDPQFCGLIKAALYLNPKKELCLTLLSEKKERKEVLFKRAGMLSFEFFNSEKKEWQSSWSEDAPPHILRFHIDKELAFTFLIPGDR